MVDVRPGSRLALQFILTGWGWGFLGRAVDGVNHVFVGLGQHTGKGYGHVWNGRRASTN